MLLISLNFFIVIFVVHCCGQFILPVARVTVLTPKGFEVSVPHQDNMVLFAFHGKINEPMRDREAGRFSRDILTQENGRWTFQDTETELKSGDTIYYWYHIQVLENGRKLGHDSKLLTFNVTDFVPTTTETDQEEITNTTHSSVPDDPNCGSCYGASLTESQCCNTCDEVKEAYRLQKWSLPNINNIKQCQIDTNKNSTEGENTNNIPIFFPGDDKIVGSTYGDKRHTPAISRSKNPKSKNAKRGKIHDQLNQYSASNCQPSQTTVSGTLKPKQICSQQLIFSDEFDKLDVAKWQHENTLAGGGNWEFQWYTNNRSNSFVRDGALHIRPTLVSDEYGENFLTSGTLDLNGGSPADACTNAAFYGCIRTGNSVNILNPIKSARIRTVDTFNFKYGRIEIRAKTPTGDWLWPAIWLLPRYNAYGGWPASGEIDILESRGNKKLTHNGEDIGANVVSSTLHFGPNYAYNRYPYAQYEKKSAPGNTFYSDFHNYTMVWTPESITFYYDNEKIGQAEPTTGGFWELGHLNDSGVDNPWKGGSKMAPFDQEFYLIINLAVGGVNGYFPDDAISAKEKPWKNNSPKAATDFWNGRDLWLPSWYLNVTGDTDASFQIDYVRVYAL